MFWVLIKIALLTQVTTTCFVREIGKIVIPAFLLSGALIYHHHINPFICKMDSSTLTPEQSISNNRSTWLVLLLPCFIEIPEFNANSIDPDQTPRSAASDLGLHCLPISLLWDARLKWVKGK